MNSTELTNHFRTEMRGDLAKHLHDVHGIAEPPKTKQGQDKLHRSLDHGTDVKDANAARDTSVLAGVTRKPTEAKAANTPKPKPTARKKATETVPLPGDAKPAQPVTRKPAARSKPATGKPATGKPVTRKPAEQPKPEIVQANGHSPREHNQEVARKLLAAVTAEFKDASEGDQQKVANWLHMLPTGGEGAGWLRYWPTDFPRPTSAGWRKP